jgi:hypothetical protein
MTIPTPEKLRSLVSCRDCQSAVDSRGLKPNGKARIPRHSGEYAVTVTSASVTTVDPDGHIVLDYREGKYDGKILAHGLTGYKTFTDSFADLARGLQRLSHRPQKRVAAR